MLPTGAGTGTASFASLFCLLPSLIWYFRIFPLYFPFVISFSITPSESSSCLNVRMAGNLCAVSNGRSDASVDFSFLAIGLAPGFDVCTKTYSWPGIGWEITSDSLLTRNASEVTIKKYLKQKKNLM